MTTFKVGDRVKCVRNYNNNMLTLNHIYTIEGVSPNYLYIKEQGWDIDMFELVSPAIEVGKTYTDEAGIKRKIIFADDKGILIETEGGHRGFWLFSNSKPNIDKWKEYIPEKFVVIFFKDNLKNSVETCSEWFDTEQSARDRWASNVLFAGVSKLENKA